MSACLATMRTRNESEEEPGNSTLPGDDADEERVRGRVSAQLGEPGNSTLGMRRGIPFGARH
jgi:hypothetical protein